MATEKDPAPTDLEPDQTLSRAMGPSARLLVIACGALARELLDIIALNGATHMAVTCLPAKLHNRPERIPEALRAKIRENRGAYDRIVVAYADCGTGGRIDRVLEEEGGDVPITRIGGPHCYAFFAGQESFADLAEEEPGTFYLTDYLVRHFETLIIKGMGLDRHPEILEMMFGNYRRVVYLAQTDDPGLEAAARRAADRLGLAFEMRRTGYGELASFIAEAASGHDTPTETV